MAETAKKNGKGSKSLTVAPSEKNRLQQCNSKICLTAYRLAFQLVGKAQPKADTSLLSGLFTKPTPNLRTAFGVSWRSSVS
jgi:hypothetical protein